MAAYFWNANAISQANQTMQNVITGHNLDLVDAAHLIAMSELTMSDAGIACFDSKTFPWVTPRFSSAVRGAPGEAGRRSAAARRR